jgi:HK97 family phage portal protein
MTAWQTLRSIITFGGYQPPPMEQRAAQYGGIVTPTWSVGKPVYPDRTIDTYQTEYAKLALIFRLTGIVANAVGAAPVRVYAEDSEGGEKELPEHPMRQLMQRPNPQMRESRFLATVSMIATVAGFCLIEKERSPGGRVTGLWTLRSDWAKPIPRRNAPPDWEYTIPGNRPITMPASDILHITYADRPDGSPFGLGALEVVLREVGMLNVMTDFLKAFFDHGAMPVIGLVPREGWSGRQEDADLIKETWRRRYGGLLNSVDPAILKDITDVKRLSFDFNELAYVDLRNIDDLALCQAFGVPPILAGTMFGLERSTFANYGEARRSFYEDTIAPFWSRMDDVLTLGLLSEFEPPESRIMLQFDTSKIPALQEDRNAKFAALNPVFLGGGIPASVYCAELDLPIPKEDFYLRGMVQDAIPADDPLNKRKPPEPKVLVQPPKALPATTSDEEDENRSIRGILRTSGGGKHRYEFIVLHPDDDEARSLAIIREYRAGGWITDTATGQKIMVRTSRNIGPSEFRASVAVINRRTVERIARTATPWIAGYFRALGERVLGSMRSSDGPAETRVIEPALSWDEEADELARVLRRLYALAGETAFAQIGEQFGVTGLSFDLANPNLVNVRGHFAQEIEWLITESREQIQAITNKALIEGASIDDLRATLQETFTRWSDNRATTIARTSSAYAYNSASVIGYRESGVVDRSQLFDNSAHDTDPQAPTFTTCADRDGMIVPLDEVDRYIASMHPNCIMAVAGVLIGEDT